MSGSTRPSRIGGTPAYVTAHAMIAAGGDLSFEEAFALARLVIEHGGGPVPYTTKKAPLTRAIAKALNLAGYVEIQGAAEFGQVIYVERRLDPRLGELFGDPQVVSKIEPFVNRVRAKWMAAATQEGFDLVAHHLLRP